MIDFLIEFVFGFFVAMWIGFFLGLLKGYSLRALIALFAVFGLIIVGTTFVNGPSETAHGLNWPYLLGTIPGYMISMPAGERAYRELK